LSVSPFSGFGGSVNWYMFYDTPGVAGGNYWAWSGSGTEHLYKSTAMASGYALESTLSLPGALDLTLAAQPQVISSTVLRIYAATNSAGPPTQIPNYCDVMNWQAGSGQTYSSVVNCMPSGFTGCDGAPLAIGCVNRIPYTAAVNQLLSPANLMAMARDKLASVASPLASSVGSVAGLPVPVYGLPATLSGTVSANVTEIAGDATKPALLNTMIGNDAANTAAIGSMSAQTRALASIATWGQLPTMITVSGLTGDNANLNGDYNLADAANDIAGPGEPSVLPAWGTIHKAILYDWANSSWNVLTDAGDAPTINQRPNTAIDANGFVIPPWDSRLIWTDAGSNVVTPTITPVVVGGGGEPINVTSSDTVVDIRITDHAGHHPH